MHFPNRKLPRTGVYPSFRPDNEAGEKARLQVCVRPFTQAHRSVPMIASERAVLAGNPDVQMISSPPSHETHICVARDDPQWILLCPLRHGSELFQGADVAKLAIVGDLQSQTTRGKQCRGGNSNHGFLNLRNIDGPLYKKHFG